jgi:hypothetical protein
MTTRKFSSGLDHKGRECFSRLGNFESLSNHKIISPRSHMSNWRVRSPIDGARRVAGTELQLGETVTQIWGQCNVSCGHSNAVQCATRHLDLFYFSDRVTYHNKNSTIAQCVQWVSEAVTCWRGTMIGVKSHYQLKELFSSVSTCEY